MAKIILVVTVILMTSCNIKLYQGNAPLQDRRAQIKWYKEHNLPVPVNQKASLWKRTYKVQNPEEMSKN